MSTTDAIAVRVLQILREKGWTAKSGRPDFVAKEFATAVGIKVASAWCSRTGSGAHWIQGEYRSEGRNVLESRLISVEPGADDAAVISAAVRFHEEANATVMETYAARLLSRRQHSGQGEEDEPRYERPAG
jgi:hypothetical protein